MSDHDHTYWKSLTRLINLTNKQTFIDVGANIGAFTEKLNRDYPGATIFAFEPTPVAFKALRGKFGSHPKINLINAALWDTDGQINFEVHENSATSSPYPRNYSGRRYYSADDKVSEKIEVKTHSLDHMVSDYGIQHIDFIKLDTQGSELKIFSGAESLLLQQKIDVIYTEFFLVPHYQGAPLLNDLWNILSASGYSIFDWFKGPNASNGQSRFGDALFISDSFRKNKLDAYDQEP